MANICGNFIKITGKGLEKFKGVLKEGPTLEYQDMADILGITLDGMIHEDFGTKFFDLDMVDEEENVITICGGSAWGPPIGFFEKLSKIYSIDVTMDYEECGMNFGGQCIIKDGVVESDHELSYYGYQMEYGDGMNYIIEDVISREYESMEEFMEDYREDHDFMERVSEEDLKDIEETINAD